jgi:hypothetical protein
MNAVDKPFIAFGDESHSNDIVTFAYVIVPAVKMASLELALKEVKSRNGLPEDARIHCRSMFNEAARAKTVFATFTTEDVLRILYDLMSASFDAGARGWIGYLSTRNAPDSFFMEPWDKPDADKSKVLLLDKWDVSGLKSKMMLAYLAATVLLSSTVLHSKVHAFIDGDRSKIPSFDQRHRQVDSLRSFFGLDTNDSRFEPESVHGTKPLPLDLADVLAYASARALTNTALRNKIAFASMTDAFQPGYCEVEFNETDVNGHGMRFRVSNYAADQVKAYMNQFV